MQDSFSHALLVGAAVLILIIFAASGIDSPGGTIPIAGITSEMWISETENRKTSLSLRDRDSSFKPFHGPRASTTESFAYLWVSLRNTGDRDQNAMVINQTRNYYTEFLQPGPLGASVLYRQGDIVPVSQSPVRHHRTIFPVTIPARSTIDFVLEYHGPRGIIIDPLLMLPEESLSRLTFDRTFAGFLSGMILILLLFNIAAGLILGDRSFYALSFFIAALFFFFLRQSRVLLLLIDPLSYPEWLFPFSIALNIWAALIASAVILRPHLTPFQTWAMRAIAAIALVLACVSFFFQPYLMADILNLVSIGLLAVVLTGGYHAFRKGEREILWIILSSLPWIAMMLFDILSGFLALRTTTFEEYRQVFGLVAMLILLSVTFQRMYGKKTERRVSETLSEIESIRAESGQHLSELSALRISLLKQTGHELRYSLDSIIASARLLGRENADPKVLVTAQVIIDEAQRLKSRVSDEIDRKSLSEENSDTLPPKSIEKILATDSLTGRPFGRILIYDSNQQNAMHTSLVLRAEGFSTAVIPDRYQALYAAAKGEADVLIIDPSSTGEYAFSLCALIRETCNMMDLPILMITDYHAELLMRKGYSSGVNDFLTRPFDASELTTRIQSLVRLKQIAGHNQDLARSEKEKNAFLFFLTHNVNTPLTVLLNRVRDLDEGLNPDELPEIIDDLRASTQEINDIVQNVLISFRLADGRQTLRIEDADIRPVLSAIEEELRKKAEAKFQSFSFAVPDILPEVHGDVAAIRGVLYNLVDNAVKFTPKEGRVSLRVTALDPVTIEVKDSGPGVPASERERLFCRFERLSPQPTGGESSTGLGLYVANELARMNGGFLRYADAPEGACFVLTLPVSKPREPQSV